MTAYLILHGWQNHRPKDHWQHWLADRLTELGHQVTYPQLPDPDDPELELWLEELGRHLSGLDAGSERAVVAHSLSAVLWLHAAARGLPGLAAVDRVLLVAPPSPAVLVRHPEVTEFALFSLEFTVPGPTRLVAGDNDPYCEEGADTAYGDPLALPTDIIPGAAHLDLDAGYGPWPAVLDWCLDPGSRLTARPGQGA